MVDAGDPDAAADHPDELIALGLLDQALRSDGKPRRPMNGQYSVSTAHSAARLDSVCR
jgi:hypothetical protein